MQTRLTALAAASAHGQLADAILRKCVHCGFCNATCPTYQLRGDELDGPRGRIYQIKQCLEGLEPTRETQRHLDRCLTCLNCETTCPSGVDYGRLVDIGREWVDARVTRPWRERALRRALRLVLPKRGLFALLLGAGRLVRPLLPALLKQQMPRARPDRGPTPTAKRERRILLPDGCVQNTLAPTTQGAARRVFDYLGIEVIRVDEDGCCGAIDQHLGAAESARAAMRRNIDAWWPHVENGIEAIVITASGCGVVVKDYAQYLRDDPDYAGKAARVSALARDPVELIQPADVPKLGIEAWPRRIAFHAPCTLQHGQRLGGRTETLLEAAGFELTRVADSHLCCGSAGTYSILQRDWSQRLRSNKLKNLRAGAPALIATANIGCQLHLAEADGVPVVHWLELLDPSAKR
ncbi:MAG: glycolate oxidase subunit GlcF [Chromatiales bacterium]|nr:glycolate oxidase subunit GlcF [Chromatiales bacterium]